MKFLMYLKWGRVLVNFIFFFTSVVVAQESCQHIINRDKFYFTQKIIKKSEFKKKEISTELKNNIKKELIEQISTKITVVSRQKTSNIVQGETGKFTSLSSRDVNISAFGSVDDPEFFYCSANKKYFVYCLVNKERFDYDLYNETNTKVSLLDAKLNDNRGLNQNHLDDLKSDYYYVCNTVDLISKSTFIPENLKKSLIELVANVIVKYDSLQKNLVLRFDSKLAELYSKLNDKKYFEINSELTYWYEDKLQAEQIEKLNKFKISYEKSIFSHISNLRLEIEKGIKNRKELDLKIQDLFDKYSQITFYKDHQDVLDRLIKRYNISRGSARSNLSFGVNFGSTFQAINKTSNITDISYIDIKYNFNQMLPSLNIGLKHFLFNPKKRLGISAAYKTYFNTFKIGDSEVTKSIQDFTAYQAGIIFGPLELAYGPTNAKDIENQVKKLDLVTLKFGIFRSDKLINKFSKRNYLDLSIYGDYLSDFKQHAWIQAGVALQYNFAFNRSSKF